MSIKRLYIYRFGTTTACALTGEKDEPRLPTPLAPDRLKFWMQTGCNQTDDDQYGFSLETAVTQIAARGFYLFIGSMKLLDARVGVAADWFGGGCQHGLSTTSVRTIGIMTKAHRLFSRASYDRDTLNMFREVLDEAWASISTGFGSHFREIEAARFQLATIVIDLARDGQLGQLQITRTAARLMRENHATIKQRS